MADLPAVDARAAALSLRANSATRARQNAAPGDDNGARVADLMGFSAWAVDPEKPKARLRGPQGIRSQAVFAGGSSY